MFSNPRSGKRSSGPKANHLAGPETLVVFPPIFGNQICQRCGRQFSCDHPSGSSNEYQNVNTAFFSSVQQVANASPKHSRQRRNACPGPCPVVGVTGVPKPTLMRNSYHHLLRSTTLGSQASRVGHKRPASLSYLRWPRKKGRLRSQTAKAAEDQRCSSYKKRCPQSLGKDVIAAALPGIAVSKSVIGIARVRRPNPNKGARLRKPGEDPIAAALLRDPGAKPSRSAVDKGLGRVFSKAFEILRKHGHHSVALELFSRCAQLSKALDKQGSDCVAIEIKYYLAFDLIQKYVLDTIFRWIPSRCVVAVWLGTPCSNWSRARHDINEGGPRSKQHIFGVPELSPGDPMRVGFGNITFRISVRIISKCIQNHTPAFAENPNTSMLVYAPPMRL